VGRTASIVILGAGPAGAACAVCLARAEHRVLLLHRPSARDDRIGELAGPSLGHVLKAAGIELDSFAHHGGVRAIQSAWGSADVAVRDLELMEAGVAIPVERLQLEEALRGEARRHGADVVCRYAAELVTTTDAGWRLSIAARGRTQEIEADYVVEATGRGGRSLIQPAVSRYYCDRLVCLSVVIPRHRALTDAAWIETCAGAGGMPPQPPMVARSSHCSLMRTLSAADLAGSSSPLPCAALGTSGASPPSIHQSRCFCRMPGPPSEICCGADAGSQSAMLLGSSIRCQAMASSGLSKAVSPRPPRSALRSMATPKH
jgi:2-polyprenyl-6-methoxyphenol hydroxylase-like FAD-dependent oxidoreductase